MVENRCGNRRTYQQFDREKRFGALSVDTLVLNTIHRLIMMIRFLYI